MLPLWKKPVSGGEGTQFTRFPSEQIFTSVLTPNGTLVMGAATLSQTPSSFVTLGESVPDTVIGKVTLVRFLSFDFTSERKSMVC